MTTEQLIQELINGKTVFISDDNQAKQVQKRLRDIKKNCTEVLIQLKERL